MDGMEGISHQINHLRRPHELGCNLQLATDGNHKKLTKVVNDVFISVTVHY